VDAQQQLDAAIGSAMSSVPGCLAAGIVNLDIGALLSYKQTTKHPVDILEMTAAATQDFFEGGNVKTIEKMIADSRGVAGDSLIESVVMVTRGTQHLMIRGGKGGRHVVVFVCRKDANVGMMMVKGAAAAKDIFKAAE
jgi:hypothetical protein